MILRIDRLTNATPAPLGLGLALLGPVGAASANDFAFTMTQPLFPSSSFDDLQIGEAGDLTSLPLPSGLEFPWDVDVVGDRLFVVGAGQDDGTTPPSRQFNTANRGAVPNLPEDAFIEAWCDLDAERGPTPRPGPPLPRGVRGRCEQVLDTHELTAEAVFKGDRKLLRRALLSDPLTRSIGDADAVIAALVAREARAIPATLSRGGAGR